MYKEFALILLIVLLFFLLLRYIKTKFPQHFKGWIVCSLLIIAISNTFYNLYNVFPEWYYDTVDGHIRYGDFSENLFSYSEGFIFPDQILFPILRNRSIILDDFGSTYEPFFSLYSDSLEYIEISPEVLQAILSDKKEFTFREEFRCISTMDYINIPNPSLEKELSIGNYPMLNININSLYNCSSLVIVTDQSYNLYIMSSNYYYSILKEVY